MPDTPLALGSTIGILGGGQLGRMLAMAAAKLGLRAHVYCPEPASPAFDVAAAHTCASYGDLAALDRFAASVSRITYEFENVPHATAAHLAAIRPVLPPYSALATTQDRLAEKRLALSLGLAVTPFAAIDTDADLPGAIAETGLPAILKTRRLGYDGKGQVMIGTAEAAPAAFAGLGRAPAILEGFVRFTKEISVVAARGADGAFAAYDPARNEHAHGILRRSHVPAGIDAATADAAIAATRRIADALAFTGVLAVEMFVVASTDGTRLLVNEIAPRVHNTGHWTIEACAVSQFEQHIRAVAGWPLGAPQRHADAEMTNLIGQDLVRIPAHLAEPGCGVHVYGKGDPREGRKMGHTTRVFPLTAS